MQYTIRGIYNEFDFETDKTVSFHNHAKEKYYLSVYEYPDTALHPESKIVYVDLTITSDHAAVISYKDSLDIVGFDDEIVEYIKEEFIKAGIKVRETVETV